MTDENKKALLFIGFLVALLLFLNRKAARQAVMTPQEFAEETTNEVAFDAPYWWPNGIYPSPNARFESVVNVYADNPALNGLTREYFPLFGLVGMTNAGGVARNTAPVPTPQVSIVNSPYTPRPAPAPRKPGLVTLGM